MKTFGVILVKGDSIRTLHLCDSKEKAISMRDRYRQGIAPKDGGVHVILGDFDEKGSLLGRSFRVY